MINIFKRKEIEKPDEKIEYLNLEATKIKNPKNFPELPKTISENKNSLDRFNSGVDMQQTGLMSQQIGQYYIYEIKHKEKREQKKQNRK